jgi:hypothetical protein
MTAWEVCEKCPHVFSQKLCRLRYEEIREDILLVRNPEKRHRLQMTYFIENVSFKMPEKCPFVLEHALR